MLKSIKNTTSVKKNPTKSVSPEFLKIAKEIGRKYSKAFKKLAS